MTTDTDRSESYIFGDVTVVDLTTFVTGGSRR